MKYATLGLSVIVAASAWWVWGQQSVPTNQLPFSPARTAGQTLYLSGQIARTPEGEEVRDSIAAETRQAMRNLERNLKAHDYWWGDVVNVTVYLKDIEDYDEMNAAYAEFFDGVFPARACVGGVDIAFGFRVEISAVAYRDRPRVVPL